MARPTKSESQEKRLQKVFGDLRSQIDNKDGSGRLTVNQIKFAFLVSSEGWSYKDAYIEAYQPSPDAKPESIHQMASRLAANPRVRAEIDRIKRDRNEEALQRESRLASALDGTVARDRMAVEIFAIATSDVDPRLRLKAWELFGNLKHVSAFEKSSTTIDASKTQNNTFVSVAQNATAEEAKASLMEQLGRLISAPKQSEEIIDVDPE